MIRDLAHEIPIHRKPPRPSSKISRLRHRCTPRSGGCPRHWSETLGLWHSTLASSGFPSNVCHLDTQNVTTVLMTSDCTPLSIRFTARNLQHHLALVSGTVLTSLQATSFGERMQRSSSPTFCDLMAHC